MSEKIRKFLKSGVDRNIVIYDVYQPPGHFKTDLLALMSQYASRTDQGQFPFVCFVVSKPVIIPGYSYVIYPKLSELYREMDGHLPYHTREIIMGIGPRGQVMLGAY